MIQLVPGWKPLDGEPIDAGALKYFPFKKNNTRIKFTLQRIIIYCIALLFQLIDIQRVYGIASDITKLKQAEKTWKENTRLKLLLFDRLPHPAMVMEKEH